MFHVKHPGRVLQLAAVPLDGSSCCRGWGSEFGGGRAADRWSRRCLHRGRSRHGPFASSRTSPGILTGQWSQRDRCPPPGCCLMPGRRHRRFFGARGPRSAVPTLVGTPRCGVPETQRSAGVSELPGRLRLRGAGWTIGNGVRSQRRVPHPFRPAGHRTVRASGPCHPFFNTR